MRRAIRGGVVLLALIIGLAWSSQASAHGGLPYGYYPGNYRTWYAGPGYGPYRHHHGHWKPGVYVHVDVLPYRPYPGYYPGYYAPSGVYLNY